MRWVFAPRWGAALLFVDAVFAAGFAWAWFAFGSAGLGALFALLFAGLLLAARARVRDDKHRWVAVAFMVGALGWTIAGYPFLEDVGFTFDEELLVTIGFLAMILLSAAAVAAHVVAARLVWKRAS